jgi:folylpolyglutamate synthase/dihydropteroate synthase
VKDTVRDAISFARDQASAGTTILICGSLYVIGEARGILLA